MSDERLDRLIDEVAKQMTAGQPSSDFRARVIASLDRRPRRAWWTSWIAVPLGAVAITMIAIAVARPFKGRDPGAAAPAPRQSSQAVKAETAPIAPTPDTTTVRLPPSPPDGFGETGKPDTRRDLSSGAAAEVAALAPPPLDVLPLGVEAIGVEALPTDSIAVTRLDAIAPMSIDPLPTDETRPPGDENNDYRR